MKIWIPSLVCLLTCLQLLAQEQQIRKQYSTRHLNGHEISIDGSLSEAAWEAVEWGGGDFTVRSPNEGDPPTHQTSFKILYDDNNLYIGIRAHDEEPQLIEKRMSRRDGFAGDWVEVNIDSYFDKQTAFSFTITAAGVRGDEFISNNGNDWDSSWDPVWFSETKIDNEGWCAELKIPFSQLRFSERKDQIWGIQFNRRIFRKSERSNWIFIPQNSTGWVHHFGELRGISGIRPQRQVELLPYTVAREQRLPSEEGNPFATGSDTDFSLGLDGKVGITSDITADFTINPDFGQVEADPSEVNLTAFETFFSEKRPFFIEGRNIFQFDLTEAAWGESYNSDNLFYSRRIGRRPSHHPDLGDNEYADVPSGTSILGAAKISGKTPGGWSIGILESVTARETATIDAGGQRREETVEPATNYFVGRLQKDYNEANTILGIMATATNRKIDDAQLANLHEGAYTGGVDLEHNFDNRNYYAEANIVFSRVSGDPEAILETQRASARYYQRPDADYISVDSTRTSLGGHGGSVAFGKRGNFKYQTGLTWRSPGIELNDIGFLTRADEYNHWGWVGLRFTKPVGVFNSMNFNANTRNTWDFGGNNLGNLLNSNGWFEFKNFWSTGYGVTREFNNASNSALRGGPSISLPSTTSLNWWWNSDNRKKVRGGGGTFQFFGDENSARTRNFWAWMDVQPSNRVSVEVNPFYTMREAELQYIDTIDDRYLFGTIDQETAGITLRVNLNVTADFTLEYYGSPFVSAGEYSEFKQITDPKADRYRDRFYQFADNRISYNDGDEEYTVDESGDGVPDFNFGDPDFNFRAFNSNLVLRWEYSPGSTLFLVWSQNRRSFVSDGRFSFGDDLNDLFSEDAQNVFLIKFNRWFSL